MCDLHEVYLTIECWKECNKGCFARIPQDIYTHESILSIMISYCSKEKAAIRF